MLFVCGTSAAAVGFSHSSLPLAAVAVRARRSPTSCCRFLVALPCCCWRLALSLLVVLPFPVGRAYGCVCCCQTARRSVVRAQGQPTGRGLHRRRLRGSEKHRRGRRVHHRRGQPAEQLRAHARRRHWRRVCALSLCAAKFSPTIPSLQRRGQTLTHHCKPMMTLSAPAHRLP